MNHKRTMIFVVVLMLASMLLSACGGAGQTKAFPSKQVTYYVCFDPGGPSDKEARRQQPIIEEALKQKVLIDYKVGGGGAVCWSEVSKAAPDGYTMVGINIPHIILQPLQQDTGYKTEDLEPVVIFQGTTMGLAVLKDSPYQTLQQLLDAVKAGNVSLGGVGTFSGHHMATLRLQQLAGVAFTYVPFTGAAQQMPEFLGGHVDAVFANSDDLVKYQDEVRVLAFATNDRYAKFADVPTFLENNLDLVMGIDRGVAVPKGTPPEVIKTLETAFMAVMNDEKIKEQLVAEGYIPMTMGHDEAKAYIEKMKGIFEELAKDID